MFNIFFLLNVWLFCENSTFCKTHMPTVSTKNGLWSITGNANLVNNIFSVQFSDNYAHSTFILTIKSHSFKGVQFRIDPVASENILRYDLINEETVYNKSALNDLLPLNMTTTSSGCLLSGDGFSINIIFSNFWILFSDNSGIKTIINFDDHAVFETSTNNVTDFGQSVGISMKFVANQIRLSGLPAHTLPGSIQNQSNPLRFYNVDHYKYEIGRPNSLYGSIPLLHVHTPNGLVSVHWVNPSDTYIRTEVTDSGASVRWISEAGFLNFFVFYGSKKDFSSGWTTLTGKASLIPDCFFGFQQSRYGYESSDEMLNIMYEYDENEIPFDVMWMDLFYLNKNHYFTWNLDDFPSPDALLSYFDEYKRQIVGIIDPHIPADEGFYVFDEVIKNLTVKNPDGSPYFANCWPGNSTWPSFLNPDARSWWETLFRYDRWNYSSKNLWVWNDMNEPSVFDAPFDNTLNKTTVQYGEYQDRQVHNLYGLLMVSATWGGLLKRDEDQNRRPFILTRSYFAGTQKYAAVWTGDNQARWDHLKNSLPMTLSIQLAGIPWVGADVTGFTETVSGLPDNELYSRWILASSWFYPFFRVHSDYATSRRELYEWPDVLNLTRNAIRQRYQHFPYWYLLAYNANQTGIPIVRPLWYEFDDPALIDVDDKAMLGDWLLIVPFLERSHSSIPVLLPYGFIWYDYDTLQQVSGMFVDVPYNQGITKVFFKGGGIIPLKYKIGPSIRMMAGEPFVLIACLDANQNAVGHVYTDDGETFDFKKGGCILSEITISRNAISLKRIIGNDSTDYVKNYNVTIHSIHVAGLKRRPISISQDNMLFEFQYSNNILYLSANLSVKDDWILAINY